MNSFKCFKMFMKLSWKISPGYIITLIVSTLISSIQVWANVILPKFLIDEFMAGGDKQKLIFWGAAIVLTNLSFAFLGNTIDRISKVKNVEIKQKMDCAMSEKIMKVEYSYLKNPYYLDLKERAVFAENNQNTMENIVRLIAAITKETVTIIGLLAIMFTLSWSLVLVLIVTVVLSVFLQNRFRKYQVKFYEEVIPSNRKYLYYFDLCMDNKL